MERDHGQARGHLLPPALAPETTRHRSARPPCRCPQYGSSVLQLRPDVPRAGAGKCRRPVRRFGVPAAFSRAENSRRILGLVVLLTEGVRRTSPPKWRLGFQPMSGVMIGAGSAGVWIGERDAGSFRLADHFADRNVRHTFRRRGHPFKLASSVPTNSVRSCERQRLTCADSSRPRYGDARTADPGAGVRLASRAGQDRHTGLRSLISPLAPAGRRCRGGTGSPSSRCPSAR
jgi:hypothetical protein